MSAEAQVEAKQEQKVETSPIFNEIENMSESQAIDVLIQASNLAQVSGKLSVRDSVMLAKAIDTIRPGSI